MTYNTSLNLFCGNKTFYETRELSENSRLLPSWSVSCLAIWEKNWIDLCPGNFPTILGISNGVCLMGHIQHMKVIISVSSE